MLLDDLMIKKKTLKMLNRIIERTRVSVRFAQDKLCNRR